MKTKVHIIDKQKKVKLPTGIRLLIRKSCIATLESENFSNAAEVDVSIVDDAQIQQMNKKYREIDRSTDVLSFPLGEDGDYPLNPESGAMMLGDIVISAEHAMYQADLYGHGFEREVSFLTVHSMLHLLGYDHVNNDLEAETMREKEESVLLKMGLSREVTFTE